MAAQKIKGLSTFCNINNVAINREEALINLTLFSNQANTIRVGLRFYLLDLDKNEEKLVTENYYWVERFEGLNENVEQFQGNIDVNLFKEINFKIDITNNNNATFNDNRWVRKVKLLIKADAINGTSSIQVGETVYASETIDLVSAKVVVPEIKQLTIKSFDTEDTMETLAILLYYNYGIESDFNYVNKNIRYLIRLINPRTMRVFHSLELSENGSFDESLKLGVLKCTFTNQKVKLRLPILVDVQIKNVSSKTISSYTKLYKPTVPKNKVYVKFNGVIKEVSSVYSNFIDGIEANEDNFYSNEQGFYIKD